MDRDATRVRLRQQVKQRDDYVAQIVSLKRQIEEAKRRHRSTADLRRRLAVLEASVAEANRIIRGDATSLHQQAEGETHDHD